MLLKKIIILSFMFFTANLSGWSFQYKVPGSLRNRFGDAVELETGDIIWLDNVEIPAEPFYNFALVKTTSNGDTLLSRVHNGGAEAFCSAIELTELDNILVFGNITQAPGIYEPSHLLCFCASPDGDSLWQKTYSSGNNDRFRDVLRIGTDTLAIIGSSVIQDSSIYDWQYYTFIVYIHENGDTIKTCLYGSGNEDPTSAWLRPDGSIDVFTYRWNEDGSWYSLFHLSHEAESLWCAVLDSCPALSGYSAKGIACDTSILLAGFGGSPSFGYLLGCDLNGHSFWKSEIPTAAAFTNIKPYNSTSAVACGAKNSTGSNDVVISWITMSGDIFRTVIFSGDSDEIAYNIKRTSNGDWVISASSDDPGSSGRVAMGIRVDSLGNHVASGIRESDLIPDAITISAYPNPFNSAITISLSGGVGASDARSGQVGIEIYDISGRLVADLPVTNCGEPQFVPTPQIWQPDKSISSGIYLIRARAGNNKITKPIVYLK